MRCADVIGGESAGANLALLHLPVVPAILGFDPRWQFVHHDDVIGALAHAAVHDLPGAYNVAADGVLVLSEIASLLGKRLVPVLPPWGTVFAGAQLRRLGVPIPVQTLRQLRFGRGLDNRRLKATGFTFRYTTREAVLKLRAQQRLRPLLGSGGESYRYEREVEEFLRWSPTVRAVGQDRDASDGADGGPAGFDDLSATELIEIISSLEAPDLARLRDYEAAHGARVAVLEALERNLERRQETGPEQ
jgi:UDP-glucose 4-epimerase